MSVKRRTQTDEIEVWDLRFSYFDHNNKRRHYQRRGFRTKKDAERAERQARSTLDAGDSLISADGTVGEYLLLWLERRKFANDLKASSMAKTIQTVNAYLIPHIGDLPLRKLDSFKIQALYVELLKSGRIKENKLPKALSAKTVRDIAGVLFKALSDCVSWRIITSNPAKGVKLPRFERPELTVYDGDETGRFLNYANSINEYLVALYRLSLLVGLRRGEVLGLRWSDVDLVLNNISVVQTRIAVNGKIIISTPKTRAGRRTISIDTGTADALARLKNQQEQLFGTVPDLVSTDDDGRPVHPLRYSRHFKRLAKAAGLKQARLHDARHTATTLQLHNGVSVPTVLGRLGWTSNSTILDTYAAYLPSADREASNAVAVALDRAIANAQAGRALDAQLVKTEQNTATELDQSHTPNAINITKLPAALEATPRIESISGIPEHTEQLYIEHYFDNFD